MSDAIGRLCELLSERGVDYKLTTYLNGTSVRWRDRYGAIWMALEHGGVLDAAPLAGYTGYTPEQVIEVTIGRSCASCQEMDNPDSYVSHLQSALKWHYEHVPRPTNPRNTCVVLKGQNPPEEVLFVLDEGGVTHYLPEGAGTCKNVSTTGNFRCSECDAADLDFDKPTYCHGCGKKVVSE